MATSSVKKIEEHKNLTVSAVTNNYFNLAATGQGVQAYEKNGLIFVQIRAKNDKSAAPAGSNMSDFITIGKVTGYSGTIGHNASITTVGQTGSHYLAAFQLDTSGNIQFYTPHTTSAAIPTGVWFRTQLIADLN